MREERLGREQERWGIREGVRGKRDLGGSKREEGLRREFGRRGIRDGVREKRD